MINIFLSTTSDHNTSEQYYFDVNEKDPKPKLIKKDKEEYFILLILGMGNFIIIQMKMLKILK